MRFFKLLSFTLMLSILGVLPALATDPTITSTFTNKSWAVGSGEPAWTASTVTTTAKENRGVQVTLANIKNANGFSLTNSTIKDIEGLDKIVAVSLTVSSNGSGGSITGVNVGGVNFLYGESTSYLVANSNGQTPSFTHETGAKGNIIISFGSTATSKSLYIASITVTYTTSGGGSTTTTCATPTFSPAAGTFYGSQEITLATTTSGASIYYTLDGTTPSSSNGTLYEDPFTITETKTVKAIAVKDGATDSEVASATYTAGEAITSYNIDFETNNLAAFVNWVFDKLATRTTTITAHGGTYYAINANSSSATSGTSTATITTAEKIATPGILTFYISKESTNTTASSWKAQVSEDGSTWTDVETFDAKAMTKGNWNECTADLSDYTNVYVRISYGSSGAIRAIDDISLEMASSVSKPTISGEDKFLSTTTVTITQSDADAIYYTIDGTAPTTNSTAYSAPFTLNATATVKAIAVKGSETSGVAEKTFTKATVLTVAQAKDAIDAGGDLSNKYVAGTISQIDSYNSTYSSITYWISDDGTTTDQLEVYSGLAGVVKAAFTSVDDLAVGDDVTVNGTLKKYNSIYEFDKNNTIVAYKPLARLSWSADSYTANKGGSNTFPTLTNTDNVTVTYSSNNAAASFTDPSDYSTLQLNSVATGVTITASFAGNESFKANSVSYSLNIEENVARGTISFNVDGGDAMTSIQDATALPDPLPVPTKAGKNFVKWYTDSEKTTAAVAGAAVTEDITLFAEWRDPYTVTEALVIIENLENNTGIANDVYVTGIVSTAPTANPSSGRLTYSISIDGTASEEIKVYLGKGLNDAAFTAKTDVDVADQVVVYGKLYKYEKSGDITPEVNTPNHLYSYTRPTKAVTGVTLPATAIVRAGNTITLTATIEPSNATNKNVTWSVTAGSDYAEVDANGVVTGKAQGSATIQVETEDGGFTATCEVTITPAAPTFNDPTYHWKKITAASQLKAGRYYVIAESSKNKTATYELSSGALGVVTSTVEEDAIAYNALGAKTAVFELGGTAGAWTLTEVTTKDQMLGGAGTTSLTWGTGTTTWPISIDDKGNAVIGDANDNRILYNQNGSNPRVKTYSSALSTSMLLPQLYVWESTATPIAPIGGKFTINAKGDTAIFARGNLQYQQSTNTWRCAPNQTDWCGVDANLEMGNSSYDGWVDLFCWSIGAENNYGATSNYNTATYVDKSFVDWGTLFATAEEWSTLTSAEWTYLLNTRAGANDKWGMAMIDGNLGMIILPDEWKAPSGVTFVPRTNPTSELWDENDYLVPGERDHCRVKPENMPANKFTQSQWAILENAGAVFLPYAGRRSGGYYNYLNTKCETVTEMFRYVYYENYLGTYWTSTLHNASKGQADYIYTFKYSKVGGEEYYDWGKNVIWSENGRYGQSVRLVTRIPKRYTVTYVTTGSTGTTPVDPRGEVGYIEGETIEHLESGDGLTNAGYIFEGWNDGTNTYPAGAEYTIGASDVTLTAVWARESEQKWTLVETLAGIKTDGTEYVIAADGDYNVAMAALNGAIYNTTPVRKDDKILVGSDQMTVVTFENGSESGKYAIKNGSKYIASETAKSMKEQDDSFDWTITIEDGVASISTTVGYLKYNNQSPRFTTYASGQKPVAIYQKVPTVIIENETVNLEDLSAGTNIIVKDNGVLNVNEDKQVGDLTVLNGGKVTIADNVLTVTGTFLIETMMASGKSGQVVGATTDKFVGSGDGFQAYIDITLGAGATNEQWHAFTVPFPVDVLNGIYDLADNKLQNEVNYAIMDYHGDIRATGKYGWKKIRTTLVPGTFYIMATDGYRTTYRFKKKAGAALVAENSMSYSQYAESEAGVYGIDNGWNGIGNPNLFYGKVNLPVQVLNPTTYTYEPYVGKDANSTNFIVGTPFFYQASADGSVVMTTADAGANYAPARYTMPKEIKDVEVRFGNDEYSDRLYISANEDALSTYETGKDLIKMTMTSTPKVAQIFGCAYDTKLCMVNAPLRNDQAIYSLKLYAPTDGEYTITIPEVDNADIYLTYDNHIVWNVAASEYTCELKAGETNNYGLILRKKAPEVTTSVEQSGVINGINTVQKIILNDHVYILRGEKLYDVTGKMVK